MLTEQRAFHPARGWTTSAGGLSGRPAQLVLVFGDRPLLEADGALASLRELYPSARVVACSTSGEIIDTEVSVDHLAATAICFEKTRIECASTQVEGVEQSYAAGRQLALALSQPDLTAVFVLSDGQRVNGTELARGFNEHLPNGAPLSGGLAGDGTRFERTLVGLDAAPDSGRIVAVGFYGSALKVSFGSAGGWEPFGPARTVSRSERNTLFELDGQSALRLYKRYLGDHAQQLPSSALRFPLALTPIGSDHAVVRTILSIDDGREAMTFAGDIPRGASVRFMRASYEDLIQGAGQAAEQAKGEWDADLVLCVSCVGRKIVLGQRTEEETESIRSVFGPKPAIAGFYSYGELAPAGNRIACQLHNQTMTITALRES